MTAPDAPQAVSDAQAGTDTLAIEYLPLAALQRRAANPRTHSPEQVRQLAVAIREFGFTNPVLIDDDGQLIAGHGRLSAAEEVGLPAIPCIRLRGLTDAQKRALVIADNKLALNSGWDRDLLTAELGDLQQLGFDLALTGFGSMELEGLFAPPDAHDSGTFVTKARYLVLVELGSEQQQAAFFEEIQGRGFECKVMN